MIIQDFYVRSFIEENILHVSIEHEAYSIDNLTYIFFLLKDGEVLLRVYPKQPFFEFELSESGVYSIQAYIKSQSGTSKFRRGKPESFILEKDRLEIEDKITNSQPTLFSKELVYKKQCSPFQDFAILSTEVNGVYDKKINSEFKANINDKTGLDVSELQSISNHNFSVVFDRSSYTNEISNGIFSGVVKYNDRVTIGPDIPSAFSDEFFDSLNNSTGCFSFAIFNENEVRIATDYFGFNRIFYYQCDGLFVASNRYHLLIMLLKHLGVVLEIDNEKVWAGLWSFGHQISMQNFSRRMDVKYIYQLDNCNDLLFKEGNWNFIENEFGSVLKSRPKMDFYTALNAAKDEIINDISSVLNQDEFDNVVIDLTGGLDSRLVYAAATNIKKNTDKIRINSQDVPGSDDLDIAIKINNIYKYRFDDLHTEKTWIEPVESDLLMRSFYLGTYYSHHSFRTVDTNNKTISLNGACGEILARPYIARNLFGSVCDNEKSIPSFVKALVSHVGIYSPISASFSLDYFEKILTEELELIPSQSPYESLDRMYLMYRHAYHFDGGLSYYHNGLAWMPLQSKTLFKLHHSIYDELKGLEIQGNLIYLVNPVLGGLKYDDERDNNDIVPIKSCFNEIDSRFADVSFDLNDDDADWQRAKIKKNENKSYTNTRSHSWDIVQESLYNSIFFLVNEIQNLDSTILCEEVKYSILRHAISHKNNQSRVRYIYNKLSSIRDQIVLLM